MPGRSFAGTLAPHPQTCLGRAVAGGFPLGLAFGGRPGRREPDPPEWGADVSPREPGTASVSPPPLANPCRLLALPVRALAALSSAGARSRLTSGFGYNATHAASAQPEAGAAPGRWTGPLAGEAEPQSSRAVPPAFLRPDPHRIPISAGAPNRLSHSAPKHAKRGVGVGGGEGRGRGGPPRPAGCGPSHVRGGRGGGRDRVLAALSSPKRRLRASPFGGRSLAQPLACNWTPGRLRPPAKGKSPRRVERCLYKARHHLLPARPRAPPLGN